MNKKKMKDSVSFKDTMHAVKLVFEDYAELVKEWLIDYGKIVLPSILLVFISITVIVALGARDRVEDAKIKEQQALDSLYTEVHEVEDVLFEVNANHDINALISNYYHTIATNDINSLYFIQATVSQTEEIRLEAMSEYIDRYDNISVYTKPGPYENTYVAYVYSDVYLKGFEVPIPGLQPFYISTDDEGNVFINNNELTLEEAEYISGIAEQADVMELKNQVNVSYSLVLEDNENLKNYWAQVSVAIDEQVSAKLTEIAVAKAELDKLNNPEPDEPDEPVEPDEPAVPETIKVKTTTTVNVRKSGSATADIIGSASAGSIYEVIEQMANGWTKLQYGSQTGFIKSEFLVVLEDVAKVPSIGTVTTTTNLNVRTEPNQTSAKLGVLPEGTSVELVENLDGWCKIKYEGDIGYVKAEYVK